MTQPTRHREVVIHEQLNKELPDLFRSRLMLRKAVLPAAGLGTRLVPMTKELPKEMLPIFVRGTNGDLYLKPLIQAVYEQLYDVGFREFIFVVGKAKRAVEDHFTPETNFVEFLKERSQNSLAGELESFYNRVRSSNLVFVNQPEPKGFGDAVLMAKTIINEPFVVHAGDTYIISDGHAHIGRMIKFHEELGSDATLVVQKVKDPRAYGIVLGDEKSKGLYRVTYVEEKPEKPVSNLAIMPLYIFDSVIFKALENIQPGKGGEIWLTDAIQRLIEWGLKVHAVELETNEERLDIGTPETCWEAFNLSYKVSKA